MAKWHASRFIPDERKTRVDCLVCSTPMYFPASKAGKYKTCGEDCSVELRAKATDARRRNCCTCGESFVPRPSQLRNGGGKYCSVACAEPTRAAAHNPEAYKKIGATLRAAYATGRRKPQQRGAAHPQWTGGTAAWRHRNSTKLAAQARKKRQLHPERSREYLINRRGKGRLPKGTVKNIGAMQRWRCSVCRCSILRKYHIDHITPLARGGDNTPGNIQLLCPACNMTKNAKDPLMFMQSRGFLL